MNTENKQVYSISEIQKLLGLGRTKTYNFLDEVYKKQEPFRVIKIGKLYRIPKDSFDKWLNSSN
ncbi:MAG: helix-turn-helix domain-containing protein [Clostridiales bacterium]|jgi:excisionase family DNA binding protein|nr:helix-turn-helix domain-containing protein [Clostridiales bacterium]